MSFLVTRKQKAMLEAIRDFRAVVGRSPTYRELAESLGKATSTVHKHVKSLAAKGRVVIAAGPCGISLTDPTTPQPVKKNPNQKNMSEAEFEVVGRMEKFGGSFVKALAECFHHADATNFRRLQDAFADYWAEYAQWPQQDKPKLNP